MTALQTFAVFNTSTGRINRVLRTLAYVVPQQLQSGEGYIEIPEAIRPTINDYYVQSGAVVYKPVITLNYTKKTLISAVPNDSLTITNLPVPVTVKIHDTEYNVTQDGLEIASSVKGTYKIVIDKFPFKRYQDEYNVI